MLLLLHVISYITQLLRRKTPTIELDFVKIKIQISLKFLYLYILFPIVMYALGIHFGLYNETFVNDRSNKRKELFNSQNVYLRVWSLCISFTVDFFFIFACVLYVFFDVSLEVVVFYRWWWCGVMTFRTNLQGKGNVLKSPNDAMTDSLVTGDSEPTTPAPDSATTKPQRPFTLQVLSLVLSVSLLFCLLSFVAL